MNYITFVDFKTAELLAPMAVSPTGSRYTCFPPVENTDADFLVESINHNEASELVEELQALGWTLPEQRLEAQQKIDDYGELQGASRSYPLKREGSVVNLIVTGDPDFARRWRGATEVCKRLNLMSRDDRIMIHRAIRDGKFPG